MIVRLKRVDEKELDELTVYRLVYDKYTTIELKGNVWFCENSPLGLPDLCFWFDNINNAVFIKVATKKGQTILQKLFSENDILLV